AHSGGEPPYIIAVADGSRIAADVYQSDNDIEFFVGSGEERYGSALDRLEGPSLEGGYYPILKAAYTDSAGARYEQESFASWVSDKDEFVAFVRFSSLDDDARVRLQLGKCDKTSLKVSRDSEGLEFILDTPLYVAWSPKDPLPDTLRLDEQAYESAKRDWKQYWDNALARGAQFDVPEPLVMDCQRNLLIQNLMLRWRYSLGSVVYHDSYFQPESSDAMSLLALYGYAPEAQDGLTKLSRLSKGEQYYSNWERGEKLSHGAEYFYLTRDTDFIQKLTPQYEEICRTLKAQMEKDPNGLLERQRHCGDIETVSYCTFHQSVCWRGMRDIAHIWNLTGRDDLASEFAPAAESLRKAILKAVDASSTRLPDGTLFVPSMLLEPSEPVYAPITETRIGSYWNLCMPYAFATGLWPFDSDDAAGIVGFMHNHGATLLGLLRFNYYPTPIGAHENGLPGYSTTGYDNVYLPSYQRLLAQRDEADRLVLSFYGKLAHGQTRGTFVSGEGDTVGVWPGLDRRTFYGAVCSANNVAFLLPLRLMLIRESFATETGEPNGLYLAHATPRQWLEDGKKISVKEAPTCFGPLSYEIASHLNKGRIDIKLDVPDRNPIPKLHLRLRTPGNRTIQSATLNNKPFTSFDPKTETLDLSNQPGQLGLKVEFS
ncbi:MAG: hypothetical protein NTZ09_10935, partial [Candidatus Hydrogenedentes bacterium]|nr:hypothetical protein [Candidatus Hydrogenedentota bacterium]